MNKESSITLSTINGIPAGDFWPSDEYDEQVHILKSNLGNDIFLVEVKFSDINVAINLGNKPVKLLDVIKFKGHDPQKRLYPHMLILGDGRGLNLGWIARVTCNKPFDPAPEDILYQENKLVEHLLFHERQLDANSIAETSRQQLAAILGKPIKPLSLDK